MQCLQSTSIYNVCTQINLTKQFPKHNWHFPSEDYLATSAGNALAWRSLFMSLGFTDFIQTPPVTLLLSPARKAESIWADEDLGPADKQGRHGVQVCKRFTLSVHACQCSAQHAKQTLSGLLGPHRQAGRFVLR